MALTFRTPQHIYHIYTTWRQRGVLAGVMGGSFWCGRPHRSCAVGDDCQLVNDPLLNRQPLKSWAAVEFRWRWQNAMLTYDSGKWILSHLQSVKVTGRRATQQCVTIGKFCGFRLGFWIFWGHWTPHARCDLDVVDRTEIFFSASCVIVPNSVIPGQTIRTYLWRSSRKLWSITPLLSRSFSQ